MSKPLRKIAGTDGSDSLNSCPTVIGLGDDDVVLQGYKLDTETRRRLNIPEGEDAIVEMCEQGWIILPDHLEVNEVGVGKQQHTVPVR